MIAILILVCDILAATYIIAAAFMIPAGMVRAQFMVVLGIGLYVLALRLEAMQK